MKRRRHRQHTLPTQNLDSFLDILTNTVGVLMFISLFVTLVAVEASTIVRTPLVSNSKKNPYFFEVRGNRVTYIDDETVDHQIENLIESLPTCYKPNIPSQLDLYLYEYYLDRIEEYKACQTNRIQSLKDFRAETAYYKVRFFNLDSLVYEPIKAVDGESREELTQVNSEFKTVLRKLDPQTDYLAFIVRPDSFEAFRVARKQAWKDGFDVGWEPQMEDTAIVFGSQGRAIGVQ
ncbi:MAG: hypothetical protein AB4426_10025 [Xenococcaceae cyanobacterium]